MSKNKKVRELISDLELEDMPEGHTVIYIDNDAIDLLSHITTSENASETIQSLIQITTNVAIEVLEQLSEDENLVDATEYFSESFKRGLLGEIAKNEELFERYVKDANEIFTEDKEEDEEAYDSSQPRFIKTEGYN